MLLTRLLSIRNLAHTLQYLCSLNTLQYRVQRRLADKYSWDSKIVIASKRCTLHSAFQQQRRIMLGPIRMKETAGFAVLHLIDSELQNSPRKRPEMKMT